MARFLADNDIVVNCVLQIPAAPLVFLTERRLWPPSLPEACSSTSRVTPVWVSAGRSPTSFTDTAVEMAQRLLYYAVDHSPSYLWNSATWENSEALLPHIETVLAGPAAWNAAPTISRAIEIRDGTVLNPGILSFQHRADAYPHAVHKDEAQQPSARHLYSQPIDTR